MRANGYFSKMLQTRENEEKYTSQWAQCILFSVVFTPSPPSHHGSVWLLPVISLLLTNTVSPVRLAYPYDGRPFL
jgi:hypothetical protein